MARRAAIRNGQRGLTLIELMISIAIGLVVVGAVSYVYLGSKGAYRGNEALAQIQEAGRFALESISRDVRRAGALGCGTYESLQSTSPVTPAVIAPAGLVFTPVQGATPEPNYAPLPATIGGWSVPSGPNPLPTYWGGDVLQLQITSGYPVRMSAPIDTANGNITIATNNTPDLAGNNFKPADYALVADCNSAAVFQVSSLPSGAATGVLLSYKTGGSVPALPAISITNFPTVQHFDQVTYFVGQIPNSVSATFPRGRTALYRYSINDPNNLPELVDNVEDMDVLYGVDTTGSTPPTPLVATEFVHADAVPNWGRVVSVRVSLVMVGDQQGVAPQPQSFPFHATGAWPGMTTQTWTAADTRLRQVFTATAALRDRFQ